MSLDADKVMVTIDGLQTGLDKPVRDSIAAEYHLANEETTGRTTVSPGYFETSESEAVQRSLDIQADVGVEAEKQPQVDFTKFKNV